MSDAAKALDRIEAIMDEIERLQRGLGFPCHDASNREPGDILTRIIAKRTADQPAEAQAE